MPVKEISLEEAKNVFLLNVKNASEKIIQLDEDSE